ncbi:MAG: choline-sulfatase, partial [Alphaproteobacteria bacterium]|nr:choline-sulfatase [Alphaproteobacteria bacterium]
NLADQPEMAATVRELRDNVLDGWDPEDITARCLASQRQRRFIHNANGGEPFWAYKVREDDDRRFVRNSGAAPTKAKARFPYVEPLPFEQ